MSDSYRISHRAPAEDVDEDTTVRLDHVVQGDVYPGDVLEHPDYYGARTEETIRQVRAAAASGDPGWLVTVYRAVPPGVVRINCGDWVALSREYAVGESARVAGDGTAQGNVISAVVPASALYSEGLLEEWGYQGPDIDTRTTVRQLPRSRGDVRARIDAQVQCRSQGGEARAVDEPRRGGRTR